MAASFLVERSMTIDAPPARIFEEIVDFHNWPHWSPWEDLDPDLRRTYTGPVKGRGSVYAWAGNRKAGQGRMEVVEVRDEELVRIDLQFLKPFKARNDCVFALSDLDGATEVIWTMAGRVSPAMRVMGVFVGMDKMIGPDFEKGLARLKAYAEGGAGS